MNLKNVWNKYNDERIFNLSVLPESITRLGRWITFDPSTIIVSKGEYPQYIYFLKSGTAIGIKNYLDGNEYNYFQVDSSNGNIGLLEIFAREEAYIATIKNMTEVTALKLDSALVYSYIMEHPDMLRRCITLVSEDLYKRSGNDGSLYYFDGLDRL